MKLDTLLRAAQILRSQPGYSMPLARLHTCLAAELGAAAGTYGEVYRELKKRPHSFMVLDGPRLLVSEGCRELPEESGLGVCVRVSLTEPGLEDYPADAIGMAAATLSELWRRGGSDLVVRERLSRAAEELEEISSAVDVGDAAARPTTHPRDPRR